MDAGAGTPVEANEAGGAGEAGSANEAEGAAPAEVRRHWIVGLLYTHNPFYLVSALLLLRAVPEVFAPGDGSWPLLGLLASYTALLAVTGVLVARLGRVWEDARSILLLLVLFFVAMSASFDQEVLTRLPVGTAVLGCALAFSVACTEGVLRLSRIRLPWGYRAPFHAVLALLFSAPPLLAWLGAVADGASRTRLLAWAEISFPLVSALIALTVIPAVRRGAAHADPSGTPWGWPRFPLAPLAFLGGGVVGRSYWLMLAFYPGGGDAPPFGLWFAVPVVLAAGVIALEVGLTAGSARTVRIALLAPVVALLAALDLGPAGPGRAELLEIVRAAGGSPFALALWGGAGLYAWALRRGAQGALPGLAACLLLVSIADDPRHMVLEAPRVTPIFLLAALLVVQAVRAPSTARVLAAHVAGVLAASAALDLGAAAAAHLAVAGALAAGFAFEDDLARRLRATVAYTVAAALALALLSRGPTSPLYAAGLFLLPPAVWLLTRDPHWFRASVLGCATAVTAAAGAAHGLAAKAAGGPLLFWAALSFMAAALVTAAKSNSRMGRIVPPARASTPDGPSEGTDRPASPPT